MKPSDYCETHGAHKAHKHACRKEHPMTPDNRLAALLADTKVRKASKAVLAHFETGMSTEGVECALKHFAESLLDRSAPETCDDVAKRLVEETRHMKFITDPPETLESVREEAAKALYVAMNTPTEVNNGEQYINGVDAVAPILEAPLRQRVVRLKDCMADSMEQEIRLATALGVRNKALDWDVCLAEVTRLKARLAEVEGAVREWQEAKKTLKEHGASHADFLGGDPAADALRVRLNNATTALAALSPEAPRE